MSVQDPIRLCPVCGRSAPGAFNPGPGGRPDAGCPRCGSLERQRFLAVLLACLGTDLDAPRVLLDIAPSRQVGALLERLRPRTVVRTDLGADPRTVDVWSSLTALPLADDCVDVLICYHVLEHVPDDRAAMRELARVLAPGGLGLVQVPWNAGGVTDEDPDAGEQERLRRFGQADHVRFYGDDLETRLVECGLSVRRLLPRELVGDAGCTLMRLNPDEAVWLVSPSDAPAASVATVVADNGLAAVLSGLSEQLAATTAQRDKARARARRLRGERDALQQRIEARLPRRAVRVGRRVLLAVRSRGRGA